MSESSQEQGQNQLDIASLSLQQLYEVKRQLQQEIEHLAESLRSLNRVQTKFKDCNDTVDRVSKPENEDKEILVPLTSSLYVPGKMDQVDKFMVDVGTGYYVEKDAAHSKKYFDQKLDRLAQNLKDLESLLNNKLENQRVVDESLKYKYLEEQKNQTGASAQASS